MEENSSEEGAELGNVAVGSVGDWQGFHVVLELESKKVRIRVDTGADVSHISEKLFHQLGGKWRLQKADKVLLGPGGHPIPLVGMFRTTGYFRP